MEARTAMDRRLRVFAAAACVLMALAGCAARRPAAPAISETPPAPAAREQAIDASLKRLEALAAAQAQRPWPGGADAPLPPGVEPVVGQELNPQTDGRALTPLQEIVSRFAGERPEGAVAIEQTDPEAAESALRLYVAGRQKAMEGDPAGALQDLRTATTLDPAAGEPWRELGEAYLVIGSRPEAAGAFQNAAARGLNDPRVLEMLGRWALERGENRIAAVYLARAVSASPERTDPLLPQVIDVALWRALAAEGYVLASRDALVRACGRPTQLSSSTRYGGEAGAIFRRQGDLWRAIGDADCRLGRYGHAAEAYQRADGLPSLEGKGLTGRLVLALVRSGRPAAASVAVLRDIMDSGGRAGPESVDQLRYLAANAGLGTEISSAIDAYRRALPAPASVASGLARAQAAVTGGDLARSILHEQVLRHPGDVRSAVELFNLFVEPRAAAAEAARLAAEHPADAGRLAEALLRSDLGVDALAAALERAMPRDAAGLVLVYFEAARGDAAGAIRRVGDLRPGSRAAPAVALAQIEVGLLAGRADLADQACARLLQSAGPGWARLRARGLAWLQRARAALDALEPVLVSSGASPGERLDDLLLAGDLAILLSRADDAERWYQQAAVIDPFDDRPAGRLLGLYSQGGAKPDPAKVTQVIRDLRQTMPDSRAIRAARVKEQVRRALLAQAEEDATHLAGEDPSDGSLIDLVTTVWRARNDAGDKDAVKRGQAWLESQLRRRPYSPVLLEGLTRLLIAQGESDQATARLRSALDSGGAPELSRLLEKVLRDELGGAGEADALAMRRLERDARTIGETLELADLYAHQERDVDAAATISAGLPADAMLTTEQATRLLVITAQIAQRAIDRADQTRLAVAAGLFDLAVQRAVKFSWEMHDARLGVLARWTGAEAPRMLEALRHTAAEFPDRAVPVYILASQKLADAQRGPTAVAVISAAADALKDPGVEILSVWVLVAFKSGTIADVRAAIDRAARDGKGRQVMERLLPGERQGPPPKDWRAELAYSLGTLYNAEQRNDLANAAYELALEYDADHAWACNNLGYALADRGVEVERASALLERAHAALPEDASVTDSLGWLRYKQGVILDQTDAAGNPARQGALTLLRAAAQTERGQTDPTILDHLGDALWLAGRTQEAIRAWQQTEMITSRELAANRLRGERRDSASGLSAAARAEYEALKASAGVKRRAAAAGQEVRVAPQLGEPSPRPISQPTGDGQAPGHAGTPSGNTERQD